MKFPTDVSGLMQKLANVLDTYGSELICYCAVSRYLLSISSCSSYPFLHVQWKDWIFMALLSSPVIMSMLSKHLGL